MTTKGTNTIMDDIKRTRGKRCCLKKAGNAVVDQLVKSKTDLDRVDTREVKTLLVEMCRQQKRSTCL